MVGWIAEDERRLFQALVDDREVAVDAAFQKRHHGRIAGRRRKISQEAERPEKAVYFLIIEENPAHCLVFFILVRQAGTSPDSFDR